MTKENGYNERFDGDINSLFDSYEDETEEREIDDTCVLCGKALAEDEDEMCEKCQNEDDVEGLDKEDL